MEYPRTATERFDKADIWIKYVVFKIKNYIKGNVVEIGAGCGSFSRQYLKYGESKITLNDADKDNIRDLKEKSSNEDKVNVTEKNLKDLNEKFDTIIYFNVLEHIKEDDAEIKLSLEKLNTGGHLIILVPAHQKLYGNLDKAVGHYRRYDIDYFKKKFLNSELVYLSHIDTLGYFLYFLNKIFFKKEVFPTKLKIFLWDKLFTPATILVDFILRYKYGKNILCIYKKT